MLPAAEVFSMGRGEIIGDLQARHLKSPTIVVIAGTADNFVTNVLARLIGKDVDDVLSGRLELSEFVEMAVRAKALENAPVYIIAVPHGDYDAVMGEIDDAHRKLAEQGHEYIRILRERPVPESPPSLASEKVYRMALEQIELEGESIGGPDCADIAREALNYTTIPIRLFDDCASCDGRKKVYTYSGVIDCPACTPPEVPQ